MCCIFCIFSIPSVVYLYHNTKVSNIILSGFDDTRIKITGSAPMLNRVIDEFICNQDKSPLPRIGDSKIIKKKSNIIANNLGLAMVSSKIDMKFYIVFSLRMRFEKLYTRLVIKR